MNDDNDSGDLRLRIRDWIDNDTMIHDTVLDEPDRAGHEILFSGNRLYRSKLLKKKKFKKTTRTRWQATLHHCTLQCNEMIHLQQHHWTSHVTLPLVLPPEGGRAKR